MGIFGSLFAANAAKKTASMFQSEFRSQFNASPPECVVESVRAGAGIINAFVGTGREQYGAEKLEAVADDIARNLNGNEERIAFAYRCLALLTVNPRTMQADRHYAWVFNVINNKSWEHCPHIG